MARLRPALGLITAIWLTTQGALLMSTSLVLLAVSHDDATAECTCVHGSNAICPMHHRPASGSKVCVIGSTDSGLATLGSLVQSTGLVPVAFRFGQ